MQMENSSGEKMNPDPKVFNEYHNVENILFKSH